MTKLRAVYHGSFIEFPECTVSCPSCSTDNGVNGYFH